MSTRNKLWKKRIVIKTVDPTSITKLFILNFAKISLFQAVTTGYIMPYQSKKNTKSIIHLLLGFDDRCLAKSNTQISAHWCSWRSWLTAMHCSQKTFHFLSVSNDPISILSDISITLRKSHEINFVRYFWKITNTCKRCF